MNRSGRIEPVAVCVSVVKVFDLLSVGTVAVNPPSKTIRSLAPVVSIAVDAPEPCFTTDAMSATASELRLQIRDHLRDPFMRVGRVVDSREHQLMVSGAVGDRLL